MRRRSSAVPTLTALAVVGLVAGCSDSASPTSPSGPRIVRVEIIGPDTIAPGQSAQFTPDLLMSDGTRQAPSANMTVRWIAQNPSRLRVDASGLATAADQVGEATVTVLVYQGGGNDQRGGKEIVIVPPGTYRMVGAVRDVEFLSTPIVGARVEVTPGSLDAITDADGWYRLYGVPAEADVRVSRNGYEPVVQSLRLSAHVTQDFRLTLSGPRLQLAGSYTLAIEAGGACSGGLPADLRQRTYDAVLSQTGSTVDVSLTEPRFRLNSTGRGNRFSGLVDSSGATFTLETYSHYYYQYYLSYPSVAEQLPFGQALVTEGRVVTTGTAAALSGSMSPGSALRLWNNGFPERAFSLGFCDHQSPLAFTLTRR